MLSRRSAALLLLVLLRPVAAFAHDPGLSSLELRVASDRVIADLTLAADDAAAAGQAPGAFALEAIDVRIDGRRLDGTVDAIAEDAGNAVRIRVTYARAGGARLTVTSIVPRRLARGHRELVSIRTDDGSLLAEQLLAAADSEVSADLTAPAPRERVAPRFFRLGIEHILGGYDHLLFLAALLIVVRTSRDAIKIVTAFTAAHSLTLALAVAGALDLPASIVEPLIAASIAYVGLENLVRPRAGARWAPAFGFGLIHGFGFAGALRDAGVGSAGAGLAVPLASFNAGVEAGQIAVALALLPIFWRLSAHPMLGGRLASVCSLLVALAGGYWFVERCTWR